MNPLTFHVTNRCNQDIEHYVTNILLLASTPYQICRIRRRCTALTLWNGFDQCSTMKNNVSLENFFLIISWVLSFRSKRDMVRRKIRRQSLTSLLPEITEASLANEDANAASWECARTLKRTEQIISPRTLPRTSGHHSKGKEKNAEKMVLGYKQPHTKIEFKTFFSASP